MKKNIYILISLIVSVCMIIIIFPKVKPYYSRYIQKKELYKFHSVVDVSDNTFNSLSLLNDDISNNEIFFAGEKHGSIKSIDMNFYLLKYFVEKAGIKYILYEGGYSYAQYLNTYLDTGDESILEYLFYNSSNTMSYTFENYNLLREIYEYNLTLSKNKKIKFIGIDIENPSIAIKYINSKIPTLEPTSNILKDFIDILKSITLKNYLIESKKAIEFIEKYRTEVEEYLGEEFFDISFIVKNLSVSNGQVAREEKLINNFITLYEYLPKGKYFGQFGEAHTNLNNKSKSLASYLQNVYDSTKGKVINIAYFYNNSKGYVPDNLNEGTEIFQYLDPKLFSKDNSTILIKLNYKDSIFYEKDIYLNDNNPAVNYHQYLILFTNSPSANKFYRTI
ncbi:TPA: hypothetical protein ACOTG0_002517 [Clostridium perfringens]